MSAGGLRRIREGVELDDGVTAPATASQPMPGVLSIAIHEGRNRQIRRMCEAIGHPVRRLVRTRIGPISDRTLAPGTWRELTVDERRALDGGRRRARSPVRSSDVNAPPRRANVIGLGLVGGSIGLALRERGWHVSGDDADADRLARGDRAWRDRRQRCRSERRDHVRRGAGARDRRPGEAGARRDDRRRHRRRIGEVGGVRGVRRSALRRRAPDGGQRARRSRRRRRGDVQRCDLGADARRPQRRRHVRPGHVGGVVARRRRRRPRAGTPRPRRRGGQPRSAPRRGDADAPRRRPGRGARRAAAPRRRRLPRHDPHRQRTSRHLARHLLREPRRDPVGARRA